ncbi:HEPN domain-containing protein [Salmonella enterica]|uniref:HEPN domain-containing protein n=1 Tax=Salmonella enterica TaxID=28901 RepID=UPI003F37149E
MNKIVDEFNGDFFINDEKGKNILGKLIIYEDGSFELKTDKPFSDNDKIIEKNIYCKLNDSYISIPNPMYKIKTTGGMSFGCEPVQECILFGSILITGTSYLDDVKSLKIKEFSCNIDCDKWFFENGYYESKNYDNLMPKKASLDYNDVNIIITSTHSSQSGKRTSQISIVSDELLDYDYVQDILHKAITFISFGSKSIVRQYRHKIIDHEDKVFTINYKPSFSSETIQGNTFCLFHYNTNDVQNVFCKWNLIMSEAEHLLRLYFLPNMNKLDLVLKFITYSQVIECLHRKLTKDNDKTYIQRIEDVMLDEAYVDFLDNESCEGLNVLLRDTRNYYTHYNDSKYTNIPDGIDLFYLTLKLELLIELFILKNLDFSYDDFEKIKFNVIDHKLRRRENMEKYR